MDAVIQNAIAEIEKAQKRSVPWELDSPHAQPYYQYSDQNHEGWTPVEPATTPPSHSLSDRAQAIALYSWNIDFMLPHATLRMQAALEHLKGLTEQLPATTAPVVFLQESVVSDLVCIAAQPWIRARFYITDLDSANWASGLYGTCTLVSRRLPIAACFRVHYADTRMQRDAFLVDVRISGAASETDGEGRIVRLCNTHLESLALEPALRPKQMLIAAQYMHDARVHGSILAGDLNAIQDFDRLLHSDNELKDAYLEAGGAEDADEGYTWGQQAATSLRERYGCSRMDKVYFCGGLKLKAFRRFGAGIEVAGRKERAELVELGFERAWVTDHLGVMAELVVEEGKKY